MIVLLDNDIVHKLAAFDLCDQALDLLEAAPDDVHVLPTAKYKLGNERKYGPLAARIRAFLARAREVEVASVMPALIGVTEIDSGEAVLFTAAHEHRDAKLATGDKRSLKALVREPVCQAIANALRGRVLTLEWFVLRMIDRLGFNQVRSRIASVPAADKAMEVVFGSGLATTEANARSALDGYLREMRSLRVDLLAP